MQRADLVRLRRPARPGDVAAGQEGVEHHAPTRSGSAPSPASPPVSRPTLQYHCRPRRSQPVAIRSKRSAWRPVGSWGRCGIRVSSTGSHRSRCHHGPGSTAVTSRRIMRCSSRRMLLVVRGRRQRAGAAVRRVRDLLPPVPARQPGQRGGRLAGTIADDVAQPAHQHPQGRCRLPALVDDAEHAPGHFPAASAPAAPRDPAPCCGQVFSWQPAPRYSPGRRLGRSRSRASRPAPTPRGRAAPAGR